MLCKMKLEFLRSKNIIKTLGESGEISLHKRQGRKSILGAYDLWALRQHGIKNSHGSVMEIIACAQEHSSLC